MNIGVGMQRAERRRRFSQAKIHNAIVINRSRRNETRHLRSILLRDLPRSSFPPSRTAVRNKLASHQTLKILTAKAQRTQSFTKKEMCRLCQKYNHCGLNFRHSGEGRNPAHSWRQGPGPRSRFIPSSSKGRDGKAAVREFFLVRLCVLCVLVVNGYADCASAVQLQMESHETLLRFRS